MAITPPTDIILDVARAADPDRYREAVERLARLRAADTSTAPGATSPGASAPVFPARSPRRRLDAYGQFEAFVLQSFVQSMLPKNATNVYGRGTAGEVWRSMLAERLGEELARSGQVGIAQRLSAAGSNRAQPANENEPAPAAAPVDRERG